MTVRIIAEGAMGHEGSAERAHQLVRAAAAARADMVKLQCVFPDDLVLPGHPRHAFYAGMVMPLNTWRGIMDLAHSLQIPLALDVFGDESMSLARRIGPQALKVHASDFFNRSLLDQALGLVGQVFLSISGVMSGEVERRLSELGTDVAARHLVVSTGFQAVPTPIGLAGLGRIGWLRGLSPAPDVCFMDHTDGGSEDGSTMCAMAMAQGATWIEKHLTMDRAQRWIDWTSALEPAEFRSLVEILRRVEPGLAGGDFVLDAAEVAYRDRSIKKVLAARDLPVGEPIMEGDVKLFRATDAEDAILDPAAAIGRRPRVLIRAHQPVRSADVS